MKAVVFAYHEMGCVGLEALFAAGYTVTHVVTHADDAGEERWFRSVADLARGWGVPVHVVDDPNRPELVAALAAVRPDLLFCFYFRKMFKASILALPKLGGLNLHGSLLPKYRGRAPINWVLVNGETETGVTLHYMDEKPDHGEIVAQRRVAIDRADTALLLYRKLAHVAREMLDEALPALASGTSQRIPQDHTRSSYFGERKPEDGRIDWSWPAERVYNLVRAVTRPWPGAFTSLRGRKLLVWWGDTDSPASRARRAGISNMGGPSGSPGLGPAEPGRMLTQGLPSLDPARPSGSPGPRPAPGTLTAHGRTLAIQTGRGVFVPQRMQWEGEAEQTWSEFVHAHAIEAGETLT